MLAWSHTAHVCRWRVASGGDNNDVECRVAGDYGKTSTTSYITCIYVDRSLSINLQTKSHLRVYTLARTALSGIRQSSICCAKSLCNDFREPTWEYQFSSILQGLGEIFPKALAICVKLLENLSFSWISDANRKFWRVWAGSGLLVDQNCHTSQLFATYPQP